MAEKEKGIKFNKIIPEQGFSSDAVTQFTLGVIDGKIKVSSYCISLLPCLPPSLPLSPCLPPAPLPEQAFSADAVTQFTQGVINGKIKVSSYWTSLLPCLLSPPQSPCLPPAPIPEQAFSGDAVTQFTQGVIDGKVKVSARDHLKIDKKLTILVCFYLFSFLTFYDGS